MGILAPSILAADFSRLGEQVRTVEEAGAEYIHIDVMDGVFVPALSFGFPIIRSLRTVTERFFDVHLMIIEPERYVDQFADAGADLITIHVEACKCMEKTLKEIRELGCKAGIAMHPGTPVQEVYPYLGMVDQVTVMTVNTGFGGQQYIEACTEKLVELKRKIAAEKLGVAIEADGGINKENAGKILKAGADILVAGSAVFQNDIAANVREFVKIIKK